MQGEQVKQIRQSLGLTKTELAKMLGVKYVTVHAWESGRNNAPDHLFKDLKAEIISGQLVLNLKPEAIEYLKEGKEVSFNQKGFLFTIRVVK